MTDPRWEKIFNKIEETQEVLMSLQLREEHKEVHDAIEKLRDLYFDIGVILFIPSDLA